MKKITVVMQFITHDDLAGEMVRNLEGDLIEAVEETVRENNRVPILWETHKVSAVPLIEGGSSSVTVTQEKTPAKAKPKTTRS